MPSGLSAAGSFGRVSRTTVVQLTVAQLLMLTEALDWRMLARSWQLQMVG